MLAEKPLPVRMRAELAVRSRRSGGDRASVAFGRLEFRPGGKASAYSKAGAYSR